MSNRQGNSRMGGRYGGNSGSGYDRNQRPSLNPWQQNNPVANISSLLPLASSSTEATLALANNLISNLLQNRAVPSSVPSLLDMPMGRNFDIGPLGGNFDSRSYNNMRMGNQGNFRRPPNTFNRSNDNRNKKSDGPRNKTTPKKDSADKKSDKPQESSVKTEDGKEVKSEVKEETTEAGATPKTAYDDIKPELLECHICNKSMWDGRSFENHINGRAHNIMMIKTTESYALVVDTMRQELKILDMKKNRHGQQGRKDFFCNMCDMYASSGPYHRTTVGHRKLKKYLHPGCNICHEEMPTRIDLDRHRLTPEHMLKLQETQGHTGTTRRVEPLVISTLATELSYIEEGLNRRRNRVMRQKAQQARQKQATKKDGEATEETPADTEENKESEDLEDAPPDTEQTLLDYNEGDDLSDISREKLPIYHSQRGVGKNFIGDFVCKQCSLCNRLMDSEETAEAHMRTRKHHFMFLKMLEEKSGKDLMIERNKRPGSRHSLGNAKRHKSDKQQNGDNVKQEAEDQEGQAEGQNDADVEMDPKEEEWEKDLNDILNSEDGQNEGNFEEEMEQGQDEEHYDEQEGEAGEQGDHIGEQEQGQNEIEEEKAAPVSTPEPDTPSRRGRPARRRASRF